MTMAVVVKVWDGVVLAADSATTLRLNDGSHQVYNSANKIFHLHRHLPIAAMTWGLGSIGPASIATLAKDLRMRLMGQDPSHPDWELDPATYTIAEVAQRMVQLFHDELFSQTFSAANPPPTALGLLVAGYSAGESSSEGWSLVLEDPANAPTPFQAVPKDQVGFLAFAQPEAMERLWHGMDRGTHALLQGGLTPQEYQKVLAVLAAGEIVRPPVNANMPLQDAISLAEFMVNVTAGYSHFLLGPNTVGGPTEVASMSKHERFKWISRKHYYDTTLNPKEPDHVS